MNRLSCDYSNLSLKELTQKFIEFGVAVYLAPTIASKYQRTYTEGPYTPDEVADQVNELINGEVNAAVSTLVDEGRCFLTIDEEGKHFHVGKDSL